MKRIQLYLLLSVVLFATGCPKYKPKVDFDRNANSFVNRLNVFINAKYQEYKAALPNNPEGAKRARNEALEAVLPYVDAAYMDFITDLQAGRDRTNFIADLFELGGSAAVGIVNGERPLQIIGVALTAFRGGRRSADLNFYKEQSTPVLISKMDGNRAKVRTTILTREKDSTDVYQFGAAISDIVDYYNAGTLVRAFTELQKDTAAQTKQAEDNLQVVKGVSITPAATEPQRNLSVAASDALSSLKGDLESTDAAKKAAATKTLQNIIAALEKDKDVAVALKAAEVSSGETDGPTLLKGLRKVKRSADDAKNTVLLDKINQAIVDTPQ
jgi:hypothetical protein